MCSHLIHRLGNFAVFYVAYSYGDAERLFYATDYQGNTCGQGSFADRPLGFYPRLPVRKEKALLSPCAATVSQALRHSPSPPKAALPRCLRPLAGGRAGRDAVGLDLRGRRPDRLGRLLRGDFRR